MRRFMYQIPVASLDGRYEYWRNVITVGEKVAWLTAIHLHQQGRVYGVDYRMVEVAE